MGAALIVDRFAADTEARHGLRRAGDIEDLDDYLPAPLPDGHL